MKGKKDEYQRNQDELLKDREKLMKLYDEGVIDSDGEYKLEDRLLLVKCILPPGDRGCISRATIFNNLDLFKCLFQKYSYFFVKQHY